MTDISKHGLEPAAWLIESPQGSGRSVNHLRILSDASKAAGYTETPLYRADQVAEVVEKLEAALREIARRNDLLIHQNTGRWDISGERDRRTYDVLLANNGIARAALEGKKP